MPSLYIHIPFCSSVCAYCDFCAMPVPERVHCEYIDLLLRELSLRAFPSNCERPHSAQDKLCEATQSNAPLFDFDTVYFGGGSPSSLSPKNLQKLFNGLKEFGINFNALKECSFEWNPEQVSEEKISLVSDFGINRFSLGIQTFNDKLLQMLVRKHTAKTAIDAFEKLNSHFETGSADLMFCLPNQTTENFLSDVKTLAEMGAKHISFYGLTLSSRALLKQQIDKGKIPPPPEHLYPEMYLGAADLLEHFSSSQASGKLDFNRREGGNLERYEVSNFAKIGHESKHNSAYWKMQDYLGIGVSAHSYMCVPAYIQNARKNARMAGGGAAGANWARSYFDGNYCAWKNWVKNGCKNEELTFDIPNEEGKKLEAIYLSLRTREGLSLAEYEKQFGEKFNLSKADAFIKKNYLALKRDGGDRLVLQGDGWLWLDKIAISL